MKNILKYTLTYRLSKLNGKQIPVSVSFTFFSLKWLFLSQIQVTNVRNQIQAFVFHYIKMKIKTILINGAIKQLG